MLDNIKINTAGRAEIIDLIAWLDGGTVTVKLATLDSSPLDIEFVQKVDLRVTERNPNPGRLLLNKKAVDIRSDLETKILAVLKNAIISDELPIGDKAFKTSLEDAINFVETNDYVLLAKKIENQN